MTILISACIITYNQEKFIRKAIEGAVKQTVSCNYEIVLADDYSSDSTNQICLEYLEKYPNLIRLLSNEKNLGMIANWTNAITACQGKYIALCEGDDYWTDPHKLQKQVDFLEANPDYMMCFHNVEILNEDKSISIDNPNFVTQDTFTQVDFLKTNIAHTASVVFRSESFIHIPQWFSEVEFGDWSLYLYILQFGKAKYYNDVMAVYRKHSSSIHSYLHKNETGMVEVWQKHIRFNHLIRKHITNNPILSNPILRENLFSYHYNLFVLCFRLKRFREAFVHVFQMFRIEPKKVIIILKSYIKFI
ncbi:MAG: glycosyltransferase [Chloroflexia bacterium]|nr:glycosyltransferase [Chloroflexia bacterium]